MRRSIPSSIQELKFFAIGIKEGTIIGVCTATTEARRNPCCLYTQRPMTVMLLGLPFAAGLTLKHEVAEEIHGAVRDADRLPVVPVKPSHDACGPSFGSPILDSRLDRFNL